MPAGAIQFHQQNYTQLCYYAQLENTLDFYIVRPMLYINKFSVNLLAQKLRENVGEIDPSSPSLSLHV